jgi:hypothetical protein
LEIFLSLLCSTDSGEEAKNLRKLLLDKLGHPRWHTTKQTGSEWLHIYFDKPITLNAIAIETGSYPTDFPRGLKISGAENCGNQTINSTTGLNYSKLEEIAPWNGSLSLTSTGLPYLSPEGIVKIYFQNPINIHCLLIEQTGEDNYFDWSNGEVLVGVEKTKINL